MKFKNGFSQVLNSKQTLISESNCITIINACNIELTKDYQVSVSIICHPSCRSLGVSLFLALALLHSQIE